MQTIEERVNELIKLITEKCEEMNLDARKVFLNGNCGNMFTILAQYFTKEAVVPCEILYRNYPYHIVSKIGDGVYDITGKTSIEKYINYLREHNPRLTFDEKDFEIRVIPAMDREHRIRQQTNVYGCDINGNRDYNIINKMDRLDSEIRKFKSSKEK